MATPIITETPTLKAPSMPKVSSVGSSMPAAPKTPSVASSGTKFIDSINWGTILRYSLIVLILAFLGFNLFTYLGKATEETASFLKPILSFFGYGTATAVRQTTDVAATGAKGLVDVAAGTVTSGVDLLEQGLDARKTKNQTRNMIDNTSQSSGTQDNTQQVIDEAVARQAQASQSGTSSVPVPDDAGSRTQLSRASGKSGYCYIGEDRGFRSCIKVGEADMCMSGDIFPSQEICINPNLRA